MEKESSLVDLAPPFCRQVVLHFLLFMNEAMEAQSDFSQVSQLISGGQRTELWAFSP